MSPATRTARGVHWRGMTPPDGTRPYLAGVDVGGTSTRVALALAPRLRMIKEVFRTPTGHRPELLAERIADTARRLAADAGGTVAAGGVAVAGTVNDREGTVIESPNLPQFQDAPLGKLVGAALGVPVALENDANAAAVGEHILGAGRGTRDMVYLTVSTGIGGGVIASGRLYRGALGGAGEFGHTVIVAGRTPPCQCGRAGCWEGLSSGTGIAREVRDRLLAGESSRILELVGGTPGRVTAREVFAAAQAGDALANDVIDQASQYLGVGFANVLNILNPERVVIGGGMSREWDRYIEPAIEVARRRAFRLHSGAAEFRRAELADDSGLRGALVFAREARSAARRREEIR